MKRKRIFGSLGDLYALFNILARKMAAFRYSPRACLIFDGIESRDDACF